MIKKTLAILAMVGLVFLAGVIFSLIKCPAEAAEKSRAEYIENSFKSFKYEFFKKAKLFSEDLIVYHYLADETEPKTTSYYLVVYGVPDDITLISAHKEIKLNDHLVEMWKEMIYINTVGEPFQYDISHTIIDQNNNSKETSLKPLVEIWDEVVEKLVFNKEDRTQYIKDSFSSFSKYFFTNATILREGSSVNYYISKETDPKTTSYYLTVTTNAYILEYITSIYARKEIEMGDGLMVWYQEGVRLDQSTNEYLHSISHVLMNRNDNYKMIELDTAKVWDNVIANLYFLFIF